MLGYRIVAVIIIATLIANLIPPQIVLGIDASFYASNNIYYYDDRAPISTCDTGDNSTTNSENSNDFKTPGSIALKGVNNAEKIMNFLIEQGFSDSAAAGVMGNLSVESNFVPTALNPNSGAFGIAQWLGSRKSALQKYGGASYNTLETQLQFMMHELATTEKASAVVKKITDATQAAKEWHRLFERAPGQGDEARIARAQKIDAEWKSRKSLSDSFLKTLQGATAKNTGTPAETDECDSGAVAFGECTATKPYYGAGGNGHQLSQQELTKIYGNPNTVASKMVSVDFNGKSVKIHPLVAGCLKAVANEIKVKNITYTIKEMGGYRRDGNGVGQIGDRSYHSYGAAVDINWSTNPYCQSCRYDMPKELITAFKNHGWSWGGDWKSVKDYMHFEYNGTPMSGGKE